MFQGSHQEFKESGMAMHLAEDKTSVSRDTVKDSV